MTALSCGMYGQAHKAKLVPGSQGVYRCKRCDAFVHADGAEADNLWSFATVEQRRRVEELAGAIVTELRENRES